MVSYESFGRMNQKHRTRAALKAAAAAFVRGGVTPTVAQVAEAALVSKSTAYRYFPSQEALVAEVLLDEAVRPDLEGVFAAARTPGPAATRLAAVVRADHALVVKHEAAFRTALRAMLAPQAGDPVAVPRRPGNRLRYLADALAPVHDLLGAERLERLVTALAMCVGMESIMVTADICGLPPDDAETVKRWAAAALLQAALDETTATKDGPPSAVSGADLGADQA
ncbi:MAG: TetR/AcrR family transcriptional regulator [Propionibacteriaceae bacterium]|nr:TetR/AcrR family transcriptional regulator [Propionibacteriaceae bacterium]